MKVVMGGKEVKNPFIKGVIAGLSLLVAVGITAVVLFLVLPLVGVALGGALLIVVFVVLALIIFSPLLILTGVFARPGIKGSGVELTETKMVPVFNKVHVAGALAVTIECGRETGVEIAGDDNLIEHVQVQVEDEVLSLRTLKSFSPKKGLIVRVTVPTLESFTSEGATRARISGLEGQRIFIKSCGAGKVTVSGQVNDATMEIDGAGKIEGKELKCEQVDVALHGAAKASVFASEKISAVIDGVGKITCYGNPADVSKEISGIGKLTIL